MHKQKIVIFRQAVEDLEEIALCAKWGQMAFPIIILSRLNRSEVFVLALDQFFDV